MGELIRTGKVQLATVYLIKCLDMYKIGWSHNPQKRLESLQIGSPYKMQLLWEDTIPNYLQIEKGLHWKFEDKWIRGEWFKLDAQDVNFILSLV